jgi:hypothetical protein
MLTCCFISPSTQAVGDFQSFQTGNRNVTFISASWDGTVLGKYVHVRQISTRQKIAISNLQLTIFPEKQNNTVL